jgi:hypothetical protein
MEYFGKSLSLCVLDILNGKVNIEDVVGIQTNTAFPSMESAINYYGKTYWSEFGEEKVKKTLSQLWDKVIQPRLYDPEYSHLLDNGIWDEREYHEPEYSGE